MGKVKLFFIPHAGGSAMGYMVMKRYLDLTKIEPVPLELAGRGKRIGDACFTDIAECVEDLYLKIKPFIEEGDYAFFGHSLGALLTYELVHYIKNNGDRLPVGIFFSGRVAPAAEFPMGPISGIQDEDEFLNQFSRLHALGSEFVANEQIKQLMIPVLRADVRMAEGYQYKNREPFKQDIYIFYGEDDILVTREGMDAWSKETTKQANRVSFPGDHFYFKEHSQIVMARINEVLLHFC